MLTLTRSAVEVVTTVMDGSGDGQVTGLRIANSAETAETLQAEFVTGPAERDHVVTQDGARVFLDAGATEYLADKVLDGELDEQGHLHLELADQDGIDS
jgi:Fe-S cluster assembly iron-binding protein IscA